MATKQNIMPICTLEQLAERKDALRAELDNSEEALGQIWNEIFRSPSEEELSSPTKRAMAWMTTSAGLIDGALLGWKLYRKFNKGFSLFGGKKKRKR